MKLMETILNAIKNFAMQYSKSNHVIKLTPVSTTDSSQSSTVLSFIIKNIKCLVVLRLKSFLAATLAFVLVSCAAGGGGGAGDAPSTELAVFSHSGYTFAPDIAGGDEVTAVGEKVGQVFPNRVAISALVATRVTGSSATDITSDDYDISYSINDDDISSPVRTFFSVDASTGEIRVANPTVSYLTFDQIRGVLNSNTISITMTITPATGVIFTPATALTSDVDVVILNAEARRAAGLDGTFLSYDPASVTSPSGAGVMANFSASGSVNENNRLSSPLDFARLNNRAARTDNPTTAFDISRIKAEPNAPEPTLFYAVVSNSVTSAFANSNPNSNPSCGDGAIYLDNADMRLKAGKIFDHEGFEPGIPPLYNCRLAVSTDGINYRPLAFFNTAANVTATSEQATAPTSSNSIYRVNQETATANDFDCSTSSCYYGDITININDLNERPVIGLIDINTRVSKFEPFAEGAGRLEAFAAFAGDPLDSKSVSENINLGTTSSQGDINNDLGINEVNITIEDPDEGDQDNVVVSISVSPSHGQGAFAVMRFENDSPNIYRLAIVNASLIDYENFRPNQLNSAGQGIYRITISAQDGATGSKLSPSEETFELPITDVQYNPVFVNASSGDPISPANAFAPAADIESGPNGSPLYLLADTRASERPTIGNFAAVDPETGNGAGLLYSIVNSNPPNVLERNLGVVSAGTNKLGANLIVTGPALRDNDSAILTLRVDNPAHAGNAITSVSLLVNTAAYANDIDDLGAAPSILFNSAIDLVGDFAEGPYAATANTPVTFNNEVNISSISEPFTSLSTAPGLITDNNRTLAPGFGFMSSGDFNRIPGDLGTNLQRGRANNLIANSNTFSINPTTGEISIKPTANVDFPAFYEFAIFVTPTAVGESSAYNPATSDISIVTAFATDTNEPPEATIGGAVLNRTNDPLTGSIAENRNAGTSIVSFRVTDDNLRLPNGQPTFSFTGNNAATANELLDIKTSLSGDTLTATLATKVQLDYENATHESTLADLTIMVTDAGQYTSVVSGEVLQGAANAIATGRNIETLIFPVAITLENVINERAVLAAGDGPLNISESATGTPATIFARVANIDDFPNADSTGFDDSRITLSLTGLFNGVLTPVFSPANDGSILLEVANPARLENLGDGRTFPATIIAKVPGTDATRITIPIQITNDSANSRIKQEDIDAIETRLGRITINEQDVTSSNGRAYVLNLTVDTNTLIVDADDKLFGQPLVPDLGISVVSASFANAESLNPTIDATSILSFDDNNGVFTLQINDADFVESSLFGDISVRLSLTAAGESYPIPSITSTTPSITIPITRATPKNIAYSAAPPVYALSYTQTDYLEEGEGETNLTKLTEGGVTTIDILDKPTGLDLGSSINGVATSYINITDEDTAGAHSTVSLRGAGLGNNKRFIARDTNASRFKVESNADIDPTNSRSILINLTDVEIAGAGDLDILSPDAENNLVNARPEFERYFDLQVNSTTRQLNITQRVFTYIDDAGTPDDESDDSEVNYNALDTLQLYAGAQGKHTFNYFIRAKTADADNSNSDASNYALAQFSVEVEAPGLTAPPQLSPVSVTSASLPEDTALDAAVANVIISEDDLDRDIAERGGLNNVYIASIVTTRTQADVNGNKKGEAEPDILSVNLEHTPGDNQLTANIVSASAYTDRQVGEYTAVLSVEDTAAVATVRSNEFTFSVTRVNDDTEDVVINFIDDTDTAGYSRVNFNINNYDADGDDNEYNSLELTQSNFTIDFIATDDDLLEPQTTFNAATYSSVAFTINQPGIGDTTCTLNTPEGKISNIISPDDIFSQSQTANSVTRSGYVGFTSEEHVSGRGTLQLGDIVSYRTDGGGLCPNMRIGSTITGAIFNGVRVTIPAGDETTIGEVAANTATNAPAFPAYTLQGYRTAATSMELRYNGLTLSEGAANIDIGQGESVDLVLAFTDTDSDDGYFNNYPSPGADTNIIRGDNVGRQWQADTLTLTLMPGCVGLDDDDLTVSGFNDIANNPSTAIATATQNISIVANDFTAGSCTLRIRPSGEDGSIPVRDVTIRFQEPAVAPSVVAGTAPTIAPDAITYGTGGGTGTAISSDYTFTLTDGDADSNEITYAYSIAPASSEVCQLPTTSSTISPTAAGSGDRGNAGFSITTPLSIVPIKPGNCLVQITATEDGLTSEITDASTFTVILPELAPGLSFSGMPQLFQGVDVVIYNDGQVDFNWIGQAVETDNDGENPTISVVTSDNCFATIQYNDGFNVISNPGFFALIEAIRPGTCEGSVTSTENGVNSTAQTFSFTMPELAPTNTTITNADGTPTDLTNVEVGAGQTQTYKTTLGSSDNDDGAIEVSASTNDATICTVALTSTAATSGDGTTSLNLPSTGGELSITINAVGAGACQVSLWAIEDEARNDILTNLAITVLAPPPPANPLPPSTTGAINPELMNRTVSDYSTPIIYTTTIASNTQDTSNIRMTATTGDACTVAFNSTAATDGDNSAALTLPNTGGAVDITVTPVDTEACLISVFAANDSGTTSIIDNLMITFPDLVPTQAFFPESQTGFSGEGKSFRANSEVMGDDIVEYLLRITKRDPDASQVKLGIENSAEGGCGLVDFPSEPQSYDTSTATGPGNIGATLDLLVRVQRSANTADLGRFECNINITLSEDDVQDVGTDRVLVHMVFAAVGDIGNLHFQSLYNSSISGITNISDGRLSQLRSITTINASQGLDDLADGSPHQGALGGAFYMVVGATNIFEEDGDISFSQGGSFGDCLVAPVNLTDLPTDTSFADDGLARITYQITYTGSEAGGTCPEITISATDDLYTHMLVIPETTFQFVPVTQATAGFTYTTGHFPADFDYAATPVNIIWYVPSVSDPTSAIGISLVSESPDVCTVNEDGINGGGDFTQPFISSELVTPLKPGTCTITLTATQTASGEETSSSIVASVDFPELAPSIFLNQFGFTNSNGFDIETSPDPDFLESVNLFGRDTSAAPIGLGSATPPNQGLDLLAENAPHMTPTSGAFYIVVNATNSDPGDDEGDVDVTFSSLDNNNFGNCRVRGLQSVDGSIDFSLTDLNYDETARMIYEIIYINDPNGLGGTCPEIPLTVTEDGQSSSFVIPAGTLEFTPLTPGFTNVSFAYATGNFPADFDYATTPLNISWEIASPAVQSGATSVRVESITPDICTVNVLLTGPAFKAEDPSTYLFTGQNTITPLQAGTCSITLTAGRIIGFSEGGINRNYATIETFSVEIPPDSP